MSIPLPVRSPTAIAQVLDEGAVVFCTRSEVYFGLNNVGQFIWEQLPPANDTLEQLVAALAQRFDGIDASDLRQDAVEFLDAVSAAGLVVPAARDHSVIGAER